MKASPKQYAQALLDLTRGRSEAELAPIIREFAAILARGNQAARLDRIISSFQNLWDKENSLINAEIIGAHELGEQEKAILSEYIKKKSGAADVSVSTRVDASLIGGVVIKYGDRIFDAGLKTRLAGLKRAIQN